MNPRRALLYWYLGQLIVIASQFLLAIYTARTLGPEEKGVYAAAIASIAFLQSLQTFGLGSFIIREPDLQRSDMETIHTILWISCGLIALVTFAAAWPIAWALKDARVIPVLHILAILPLSLPWQLMANGMVMRQHRHRVQPLLLIARSLAIIIVTISLCEMGLGARGMAWGFVAASVVFTIGAILAYPQVLQYRFSLASWRKVTSFGGNMLGIVILMATAPRLHELILGRLFGLGTTGFYSQMLSLSDPIKANLMQTALGALFPNIAGKVRDGQPLGRPYLYLLECLTGLVMPIYACLAIMAKPVVLLLFGEVWLPGVNLLVAICLSQLLLLLVCGGFDMLMALGRMKTLLWLEGGFFICSVLGFLIGALWSVEAAIISLLLGATIYVGLYMPQIIRHVGVRKRDLLHVYAKTGAVMSGAIIPASALWLLLPAADIHLGHLLLMGLASLLCAYAAAGLTGHALFGEINRAAGQIRALATRA